MANEAETQRVVKISIDGMEVAVPEGTTLLEAAESVGTLVPHYCYHPGLTSPAMCRLCLVEVEGAPKLQPSCVAMVQEGQVVHTQSEKAVEARKGVLEFYLVNHPLDCPICDQSGECKLQDYVHAEGRDHGRSREPKRVFGRDDFGGDVLFYGDRCVMCTRCVRFMNEVERDPRLTVVERGDRAIIDTFFEDGLEGTNFHGNIVDICPVGALVSKDFLHKQRAWDLGHTPSICPNCSQGCNVDLQTRDNAVQRIKPRENAAVNGHWMCDFGRLEYEWMNRPNRADTPILVTGEGMRSVPWEEAVGALGSALTSFLGGEGGRVVGLASAHLSNEELGALVGLVNELGGGDLYYRSTRAEDEIVLKGFPTLARRRDLAPNVRGAELLGFRRVGDDAASGGLDVLAGAAVILVLGDPLVDLLERPVDASVVVHVTTAPSPEGLKADFVLPLMTFAEQEGTFTNHEGRVQRFRPALVATGDARPGWFAFGALRNALRGGDLGPQSAADAFAALQEITPAFAGLSHDSIGIRGALINEMVAIGGADS